MLSRVARYLRVLSIFIVGASACSRGINPQHGAPSVLSKWENSLPAYKKNSVRHLAEVAPAPRCLVDTLRLDLLQDDVLKLEAAKKVSHPGGVWNGIDLKDYSPAQAGFLKVYGQYITFDPTLKQSDCKNIPCLVNALYGLGADGLAGWKYWYFYLKTGLILSEKLGIPGIALGAGETWRDYIFKDIELTGFWLMAKTLPKPYLNLSARAAKPITFHRIPVGQVEEQGVAGTTHWSGTRYGGGAYSSTFYVTFSDDGVELDPTAPLALYGQVEFYGRFMYATVPHELSHVLDRVDGAGNKSVTDSEEWQKLSGLIREEYFDQKEGKTLTRWLKNAQADGFVDEYSATNPAEDFAETSAWTRYQTDLAFKRSPNKAQWLTNRYLDQSDFKQATLLERYTKDADSQLSRDLFLIVSGCTKSLTSPEGKGAEPTAFSTQLAGVSPAISACIEGGMRQKIQEALASVRLNELEACGILDKTDIQPGLLLNKVKDVQDALYKDQNMGLIVSAQKELKEQLPLKIDAREIYVHCRTAENKTAESKAACYDKNMESAVQDVAAPYFTKLGSALSGALAEELAVFKAAHHFADAESAAYAGYKSMTLDLDPVLRTRAAELWTKCSDMGSVAAPLATESALPDLSVYDGGSTYVDLKILRCLISAIPTDLVQISSDWAQAKAPSLALDDAQKTFILDLLRPKYRALIEDLQKQAEQDEAVSRESAHKPTVEVLLKGLRAALPEDLLKCTAQAVVAFPAALASAGISKTIFRFKSAEELSADWAREACQTVMQEKALEDDKNALPGRLDDAWPGFQDVFMKELRHKHEGCLATAVHVRYVQKRCLTPLWDQTVTDALATWAKQPGLLKDHIPEFSDFARKKMQGNSSAYIDVVL